MQDPTPVSQMESFQPWSHNTGKVKNVTCGDGFFLYNNVNENVKSFVLEGQEFLKSKPAGKGQSGLQLVMNIGAESDVFMAVNAERNTLCTFQSDGRENLVQNLKEIYLSEGMGPQARAFMSDPICFDIWPM